MKTSKSFLSIFFVHYLISCTDPSAQRIESQSKSLDTKVEAKSGEKVTFTTSRRQNLEVKVVSILEYRCPSDVVCIWAGNAKVGFQVGTDSTVYRLCVLNTELDCQQSTTVFYQGKNYELRLIDVNPHPTTTNSKEEKVAKFQLSIPGI